MKSITIWGGNNYIGTINYCKYRKQFELIVNGVFEKYKFKSSTDLKRKLKRHSCISINIPEEIFEKIDCIAIINSLQN